MPEPATTAIDVESIPFRLLDLPRELYLHILSLALVQPGPICLHPQAKLVDNTPETKPANPTTSHSHTTNEPCPSDLKRLALPPALCRTSRLLRRDGLRMFYERNVFHGLNWTVPRPGEWLSLIPIEARKQAKGKGRFFLSSLWSKEEIAIFLVSRAMGFDAKAFELVETEVGKGKLEMCGQVAEGRVWEVRFF